MIGTATKQPGEPPLVASQPGSVKRTVWYVFRPTRTGRVRVSFDPGYRFYAVFTGTRLGNLTRVVDAGTYGDVGSVFDGVAGETYWIAVGPAPAFNPFGPTGDIPSFEPTTLRLSAEQ